MRQQVTISAREQGWPFWIDVRPNETGAICLRLIEAKILKIQLDEAIKFVERQEELEHLARMKHFRGDL